MVLEVRPDGAPFIEAHRITSAHQFLTSLADSPPEDALGVTTLSGISFGSGPELCTWPCLLQTDSALVLFSVRRFGTLDRALTCRPNLTKLLAKFIAQEQPDFRYTTVPLAASDSTSDRTLSVPL